MDESRALEQEAARILQNAIVAVGARLSVANLTAGPVTVNRRWDRSSYSSEVSCTLYAADELFDVIEFEVVRRGKIVLDVDAEFEQWVNAEVRGTIDAVTDF